MKIVKLLSLRIMHPLQKKSSPLSFSQNNDNQRKRRFLRRGRVASYDNLVRSLWLFLHISYHFFHCLFKRKIPFCGIIKFSLYERFHITTGSTSKKLILQESRTQLDSKMHAQPMPRLLSCK